MPRHIMADLPMIYRMVIGRRAAPVCTAAEGALGTEDSTCSPAC
ncbi:hypothetical protein [Streptomyces sp. NPDC001642]